MRNNDYDFLFHIFMTIYDKALYENYKSETFVWCTKPANKLYVTKLEMTWSFCWTLFVSSHIRIIGDINKMLNADCWIMSQGKVFYNKKQQALFATSHNKNCWERKRVLWYAPVHCQVSLWRIWRDAETTFCTLGSQVSFDNQSSFCHFLFYFSASHWYRQEFVPVIQYSRLCHLFS